MDRHRALPGRTPNRGDPLRKRRFRGAAVKLGPRLRRHSVDNARMKVVEIRDGFGLDHLALAERPRPEPGAGQVLVQIAAASLNYRDLMMIRGEYNPRQTLPLIPCSDGVGKVVGVGEGDVLQEEKMQAKVDVKVAKNAKEKTRLRRTAKALNAKVHKAQKKVHALEKANKENKKTINRIKDWDDVKTMVKYSN